MYWLSYTDKPQAWYKRLRVGCIIHVSVAYGRGGELTQPTQSLLSHVCKTFSWQQLGHTYASAHLASIRTDSSYLRQQGGFTQTRWTYNSDAINGKKPTLLKLGLGPPQTVTLTPEHGLPTRRAGLPSKGEIAVRIVTFWGLCGFLLKWR